MQCILLFEGYEEVHVPHLKAKPFESNEVPSFLIASVVVFIV